MGGPGRLALAALGPGVERCRGEGELAENVECAASCRVRRTATSVATAAPTSRRQFLDRSSLWSPFCTSKGRLRHWACFSASW